VTNSRAITSSINATLVTVGLHQAEILCAFMLYHCMQKNRFKPMLHSKQRFNTLSPRLSTVGILQPQNLILSFDWYRTIAHVKLYINLYSPKHGRNHRQKDRYIQQKKNWKNTHTCMQAHRPISWRIVYVMYPWGLWTQQAELVWHGESEQVLKRLDCRMRSESL